MAVVLDSSVWIDWLADQPGAERFTPAFTGTEPPIVPAIVCYEVLRWYRARGLTDDELRIAAVLRQGRVMPLTAELAEAAVDLAAKHKLAMADAIILATARAHGAELWTEDGDFTGLAGVRVFEKLS
ncbi:MAG: VapC toxin family PIN domain ribonuclease [Verrucomicrobiales bacterium VVV1]|nr:MAG: VapC toxin family PIN domain ribonuclease [Verrucomicrobiales bacterium VVV1]